MIKMMNKYEELTEKIKNKNLWSILYDRSEQGLEDCKSLISLTPSCGWKENEDDISGHEKNTDNMLDQSLDVIEKLLELIDEMNKNEIKFDKETNLKVYVLKQEKPFSVVIEWIKYEINCFILITNEDRINISEESLKELIFVEWLISKKIPIYQNLKK